MKRELLADYPKVLDNCYSQDAEFPGVCRSLNEDAAHSFLSIKVPTPLTRAEFLWRTPHCFAASKAPQLCMQALRLGIRTSYVHQSTGPTDCRSMKISHPTDRRATVRIDKSAETMIREFAVDTQHIEAIYTALGSCAGRISD